MAKKNSRTVNSLYNFTSSIGGQLITVIMQFVVRTVFIQTLGKSYLGINGLFSNILNMLSLTEFGVGSAILFKLYEPIAREDHKRIALLMKFYKNVYRLIGTAIAVIGLALIPFLPWLIKDYSRLSELGLNTALIFILYLGKTVSSYVFFSYKSAIVRANQKEYLINLVSYIFTVAAAILQVIFLKLIPRFEIYVLISVLQVLMQNAAVAVMANRMYPYINQKTPEKIGRDEVLGVVKDCSALFLYKLNGVVLKATDNIVLSKFLGLEMVGLYSNYYIFYTTINTLFSKIFGSISHSLGNLHTTHDNRHEYEVFEAIMLATAILGGTAWAGICAVADEFVLTWVGREWLLPQPFSFLMGFELFTLAQRVILSRYRTTMGLFQQAKFRPLAGMIINLVVSIALVNVWGISGVLVGTLVADWTTFMWFDPMIIHKYGFNNYRPVSRFYLKILAYTLLSAAMCGVDTWVCTRVFVGHGWLSVMVHAAFCGLTVPAVLIAVTWKTPAGRYVQRMIRSNLRKLLKKIGK